MHRQCILGLVATQSSKSRARTRPALHFRLLAPPYVAQLQKCREAEHDFRCMQDVQGSFCSQRAAGVVTNRHAP